MTNYYFKTLCFILLFVSFQIHAQIKPFEDYSKCMAGFLKTNGDTLYKAQFENVQPIALRDFQSTGVTKTVWMVDFLGNQGCIDESGKWLFECEYNYLSYDYDTKLFFAKKNNKAGAFRENGATILPCKYDELMLSSAGYFNYFKTEQDGLACVYNLEGKALTPECNHLNVHFLWSLDSAGKSKIYFSFYKQQDGKETLGITDETGKEISFPSFRSIEMFFFEGQVAEDDPIYFVTNDNNQRALADKNGKRLTRFFYPDVELQPIQFIEPNSIFVTYHHALVTSYQKDERKMSAVNLKTGKESDLYDRVCPFGDYFVVYQKKEVLVLDHDFNSVFKTSLKSKTLSTFNLYQNKINEIYLCYSPVSAWDENERSFIGSQKTYDQSDEILVLTSKEWKSGKEKKQHVMPKLSYQLVQTKTGKLIEKKYDDIQQAVSKEGIYLWAMNRGENDSLFVDIYYFDGIFQRSSAFNRDQADEIENELLYSKYYPNEVDNQMIWISGDSKFQAIYHNGNPITAFAFDERAKLIFSKNEQKWVFCEGDDSEGVYYNELHQPLFDGKIVDKLLPFNDNKNYYVKSEASGYLLDQDFEIIEDSISDFEFQSVQNVLKIPETYFPTCRKGDFCYVFANGKLRLLDSSMFLNPQKINQIHPYSFKVDGRGKLYYAESKKSPEKEKDIAGNLQLVLHSGTLTVTNKMTLKTVNVIKDVERFLYDYKQSVMIELTNHKQGLLNCKTGKWYVEPKYSEVKDLTANFQSDVTFFWVREEDKNDGKWFPVDVNGKVLAPAIFDDVIVRPPANYIMPFKSYGKVGLVNENFNIVVQPFFDKFVFHDNIRVYFKEDRPYLVFPNGKMKEIKHPISDDYVSKNFLFLFNDSIEVVSNDGTVLLPGMPLERAMKNYLLTEYLHFPSKNKQKLPYIYNDQVFCAPTDLSMRYYSNHLFIDDVRGTMKEVSALAIPRPNNLSYIFRIKCEVEPVWISKNICVERVYGGCFPESAGKQQNFNGGSGYRVYKTTKDTCVQLRLEDLVREDLASTQKLDDLIRAEIQKKQSFGLVCANMDGAIAEFKNNFSVDREYLFLTNEPLSTHLAIPIKNLKDILRNPEWFEN